MSHLARSARFFERLLSLDVNYIKQKITLPS